MNKVYIDTTDNKKVMVKLTVGKEEFVKEKGVAARSAQLVLPLIEELLTEHALKLQDLDEVEVNTGPGSFTGVRVGVSIANALAFGLGIPVNGTKIENGKTLIEPTY